MCQPTLRSDVDETVRLVANQLMQSRSGSLVPVKSSTLKMSLTQQFSAAGTEMFILCIVSLSVVKFLTF